MAAAAGPMPAASGLHDHAQALETHMVAKSVEKRRCATRSRCPVGQTPACGLSTAAGVVSRLRGLVEGPGAPPAICRDGVSGRGELERSRVRLASGARIK